ncbi:MAG: hypothetical protein IPJ71_19325 [Bdellovibrionales bacterium]|nr:hypothetical protein [Bdellovibrionales bacterium]
MRNTFILFTLLFSTLLAQAQTFQKTIPYQQSQCHGGKSKVELLLRFDKKIAPEENDFSGAPMVFIKSPKPQIVESLSDPYPGDFSFVKPNEGSICDKTQGYELNNGIVAILYSKDNRPFKELYQVVVFNTHTNKILDKKEIGAVTQLLSAKNGFAFATMIPRSDVDQINMTSNTGQKMSAFDKDLEAVESIKLENDKLKVEFDPNLSFENSNWKKYFKNKDDYLKTAGWSPEKKDFSNSVVYEASYFNRNESDIQESCIVMVKKRGDPIQTSMWRCLREKQ